MKKIANNIVVSVLCCLSVVLVSCGDDKKVVKASAPPVTKEPKPQSPKDFSAANKEACGELEVYVGMSNGSPQDTAAYIYAGAKKVDWSECSPDLRSAASRVVSEGRKMEQGQTGDAEAFRHLLRLADKYN